MQSIMCGVREVLNAFVWDAVWSRGLADREAVDDFIVGGSVIRGWSDIQWWGVRVGG